MDSIIMVGLILFGVIGIGIVVSIMLVASVLDDIRRAVRGMDHG